MTTHSGLYKLSAHRREPTDTKRESRGKKRCQNHEIRVRVLAKIRPRTYPILIREIYI